MAQGNDKIDSSREVPPRSKRLVQYICNERMQSIGRLAQLIFWHRIWNTLDFLLKIVVQSLANKRNRHIQIAKSANHFAIF